MRHHYGERIITASDIGGLTDLLMKERDCYVVADRMVAEYVPVESDRLFILDLRYPGSGEEVKSLSTVESIICWLLEQEAGRDAFLVGVGGGVVTDITGFAASIYKRGIRYGLVPTTLLSQVDAAIGGKTGVNVAGVKNVAGLFSGAEWVYIDPLFLNTLSEEELLSGVGELLKSFMIGDKDQYERAVNFLRGGMLGLRIGEYMQEMILRAVEIKREVVRNDRYERGGRAVLNLGHTVAHAIEGIRDSYRSVRRERVLVTHGEAVAAGILFAAGYSASKGYFPVEEAEKMQREWIEMGFRSVRDILPERGFADQLVRFIRNDKKRKGDFIKFAALYGIGDVRVKRIKISDIEEAIYDLYND